MMISFDNPASKDIFKLVVICSFLILIPAVILLSFTISSFNTYQPGRAQEVPTPTNPPWIIIVTTTPVPPVPTATPAPVLCTDSDDGNNYYLSGSVSGSGTGCSLVGLSDSCLNAAYLKEYYCETQQMCAFVYFNCPYGCSNGACRTSPVTPTSVITSVTEPSVTQGSIPLSPTNLIPSPTFIIASPTIPSGSPTLTAEACPRRGQGDADCNGIIDLIDFEMWRLDFVGSKFNLASDFDPNGKVDLIDFEIWRLNFLAQ